MKICQFGSQCLTKYCCKKNEDKEENVQEEIKEDHHGHNLQEINAIGYKQGYHNTVFIEDYEFCRNR
ncbi:unnamed protein product [Moneuplotes crassus]|uniref:Uncharacterized protein n=1 Tax=Euplotes crassus TaxID=5936 RepID=A0AAD1UBY8_EUPCR|nr:unnamed protein product [Moneuplotes crassus]